MAAYIVKKGLNLRLAGAPDGTVADAAAPATIVVRPTEYEGIKPRLFVKEGDSVKRGTPLFFDKKRESFRVTSPAGGVVKSIVYGPRRVIEQIVIEVAKSEESESFPRTPPAETRSLNRRQILDVLLASGLLHLIRQRPFGRMANPDAEPKAIFVNAMNTAPFTPDINVALKGRELAFQAGLDALSRLTAGTVYLCVDGKKNNVSALLNAKNAQVHTFEGPYPAGNTSVHISRLAPMKPTDIVWTVRADDAIQIGHLLLNGELPVTRVISVAGHGVREGERKHVRVRVGQPVQTVLQGKLVDGETRIIRGDVFAGAKVSPDDSIRPDEVALTVLPEDRERHLLGWAMPGFSFFSVSKAFASSWLGAGSREWKLGTNQHGELRPMVLTGLYDKYMPMNIMVDYVVRAVLANDTEEAIKLGILETLPEDYAACAFACPSKMDLVGIIRKGLNDIEKEGI